MFSRTIAALLVALLLCQPVAAVAAGGTATTPDDWPGTRDGARPVGPGEWNGTFENASDRDVLRLGVSGGERVSLSLVTEDARSPSMSVRWTNGSAERNLTEGGTATRNATGAVVNRTVTAPGSGTLYIALSAADPSPNASWSLHVATERTTTRATTGATSTGATTDATVRSVATAEPSSAAERVTTERTTVSETRTATSTTSTPARSTTARRTTATTAETTTETTAPAETGTITTTRTATATTTETTPTTGTAATETGASSETTRTTTPTATATETATETVTATETATETATAETPTPADTSGDGSGASTDPSGRADSFVVRQGEQCVPVTPLSDDSSVEEFYDYRNPFNRFGTDYSYSSHMPDRLTEAGTSRLFLYDGPNGVSLVMVHNERGADTDGAATFAFEGLPADGEWAVVDDDYPGQDDRVSRTRIDWTWRGDRTDGGAFRGMDRSDLNVTIRPTFGEDAALYGPSERTGHVSEWQVLSGDRSNPDAVSLHSTDRPVTIRSGTCGGDVGGSDGSDADRGDAGGTGGSGAPSGAAEGSDANGGGSDSAAGRSDGPDAGGETNAERSNADSTGAANVSDAANASNASGDGTRRAADGAGNAGAESGTAASDDAALETRIDGSNGGSSGSPLDLGAGSIVLVIVGMLIGVAAVLYAVYGYT